MNSVLKTSAWLVMSMALALQFGCSKVNGEQTTKTEPVRLVRVVKVAASTPLNQQTFAGEIRPRYESELGFRVGGKIVERKVEIGSMVKPGQVLARLDPKDLQLGLQALQAELSAANSDLALAEADYRRFKDLRAQSFISQAEFDRREAALNAARQRVAAASAQANQARNQANYAALIADHAGVVTALTAEVGQVVGAGQPVAKVARLEEKEVVISVPEQMVERARTASDIAVTLWAQPDKRYAGKLRELAPSGDPATRTFSAKITVTAPDDALRLGMTAQVMFNQSDDAVVMLPLSALYTKNDQPNVWIVDPKTSKANPVAVKTAGISENQVIIAAGVRPGDMVVTAGANLLIPGQLVRPIEGQS